jgi:hypothetical protein
MEVDGGEILHLWRWIWAAKQLQPEEQGGVCEREKNRRGKMVSENVESIGIWFVISGDEETPTMVIDLVQPPWAPWLQEGKEKQS